MLSERDRQVISRIYQPLLQFATVVGAPLLEPADLVQDVLVRVLERGGLDGVDAPEAYLRKAIVNRAVSQQRSLRARSRSLVRLAVGVTTEDRYPSELADLMRLPPRSRAVLYLSAVEGLPFREIADLLGCSEGSARVAASRARRRLAALLAAEA